MIALLSHLCVWPDSMQYESHEFSFFFIYVFFSVCTLLRFYPSPKYLLLPLYFADCVIPMRSNRSSQSADVPLWLVRCKLLARLSGPFFPASVHRLRFVFLIVRNPKAHVLRALCLFIIRLVFVKKTGIFAERGKRRDEESLSFLCEGTEDGRRDGRYKINLYLEL